MKPLTAISASFLAALTLVGSAQAVGGHYRFAGGTPGQRSEVRRALEASSFDWSLVPETITVRIGRNAESDATPGTIGIDASLLASGRFAWAIVQHEYAHQVDFFLFDDSLRARLLRRLGGRVWFWDRPGLAHAKHGCERFASTLAWAYWPSKDNSLRPSSSADESAAMAPARFRSLINSILRPARALRLRRLLGGRPGQTR